MKLHVFRTQSKSGMEIRIVYLKSTSIEQQEIDVHGSDIENLSFF